MISGASQIAEAQGPAVSAPNGKIEFDAGALNIPSSFVGRVAGTLTLPLGDAFGIQADMSAASASGFTGSAALHLFTRDPQSHLLGGTIGAVWTPGASIVALGPEAEFYIDMWTLQAWGGVSISQPASGGSRTSAFGMADIAFYPTDHFRVSAGMSLLEGFSALHLGAEYLFDTASVPLALTGEARFGQNGSILATIGLRFYFGGPDKSLIRRHREDDPWDRGASLFMAIGGQGSRSNSPLHGTSTPSPNTVSCDPITEKEIGGVCVPFDT